MTGSIHNDQGMNLSVVIMAAGKGTRMKSSVPKVLHEVAKRAMLLHVLDTAQVLKTERVIVITGHGADQVEQLVDTQLGQGKIVFARQEPQLGTGHAVQQAVPKLPDDGVTLILNGDVPLIQASTVTALVQACGGHQLALLTIQLPDPTGYGRVVRDVSDRRVLAIVEQKDASPAQRQIQEVYTGIMAAPTRWLKQALLGLKNNNVQGEYYLTDVVSRAVVDGLVVVTTQPTHEDEVLGVNSPTQLADLERRYQRGQALRLLEAGVRMADPERFDLRGNLQCGQDVTIDVNCIFEGDVVLGDGVCIGAHCFIANARIEAGAVIHPFSHIDGRGAPITVGPMANVGPYARLRPGSQLGSNVHIGNFVEVKNSTLAAGVKANHLAYLGDATVGERVNFGAGSIIANYDGVNKHQTVIGNDVQVGSNCVLIAPLTLGDGSTIGGGSTLTKNAPAGQLTLARARAVTVPGWHRPTKKQP